MNTILKTGTATAAALLGLLVPVPATAGAAVGASVRSAQPTVQECRESPTLVEAWVRAGRVLPSCVRQHNLALSSFGDDRRTQ